MNHTSQITADAQKEIDRLTKISKDIWDEKGVIDAITAYYSEIGAPLPKVEVIHNPVLAFETSWALPWDNELVVLKNSVNGNAWGVAYANGCTGSWGTARDEAWEAVHAGERRDLIESCWKEALAKKNGKDSTANWDGSRGIALNPGWDIGYGIGAINTGLNDTNVAKLIALDSHMMKAAECGLGIYFPLKDKIILVPYNTLAKK